MVITPTSLRFSIFVGALAVMAMAAVLLSTRSLGAPTAVLAPISASQTIRTSGSPAGMAIDGPTGRGFLADSKENSLLVFDVATGNPVAYVPTGREPHAVVIGGGRAYVANAGDATITVVDTSTNKALKTLAIGGLGLGLNAQTNRLYAAAGSRLFVLDTSKDRLVTTIDAPAGATLWGVAFDQTSNRVYVTDAARPRVLVYDGAKNALVGEVAIDAPARFGIAIGPLGRVYVSSYTDQNPQLSVIDGLSLNVVSRSPAAKFATTLAVDAAGTSYSSTTLDASITATDVNLRASTKVTSAASTGAVTSTASSASVAINPATGGVIVATSGGAAPPARLFPDEAPVVKP